MATPNYSYEKRQRELAKKRKNEEKAQKKKLGHGGADGEPDTATEGTPGGNPSPEPGTAPPSL